MSLCKEICLSKLDFPLDPDTQEEETDDKVPDLFAPNSIEEMHFRRISENEDSPQKKNQEGSFQADHQTNIKDDGDSISVDQSVVSAHKASNSSTSLESRLRQLAEDVKNDKVNSKDRTNEKKSKESAVKDEKDRRGSRSTSRRSHSSTKR